MDYTKIFDSDLRCSVEFIYGSLSIDIYIRIESDNAILRFKLDKVHLSCPNQAVPQQFERVNLSLKDQESLCSSLSNRIIQLSQAFHQLGKLKKACEHFETWIYDNLWNLCSCNDQTCAFCQFRNNTNHTHP